MYSSLSVFSPELSELPTGWCRMSVPQLGGDAMQLSIDKDSNVVEKAHLKVLIEPQEITIARRDQKPIKVEDNYFRPRAKAFESPMAKLALSRSESDDYEWRINTAGMVLYEEANLYDFVSLVAGVVKRKIEQNQFVYITYK